MQLQIDKLGKVSITVEKGYWDMSKDYDKLTVVEKEGTFGTYISRKPVPAGTELTNREYWIPFSSLKEQIIIDYNAFIDRYKEQLDYYSVSIEELRNGLSKLNSYYKLVHDVANIASNNKTHLETIDQQIDNIYTKIEREVKAITDFIENELLSPLNTFYKEYQENIENINNTTDDLTNKLESFKQYANNKFLDVSEILSDNKTNLEIIDAKAQTNSIELSRLGSIYSIEVLPYLTQNEKNINNINNTINDINNTINANKEESNQILDFYITEIGNEFEKSYEQLESFKRNTDDRFSSVNAALSTLNSNFNHALAETKKELEQTINSEIAKVIDNAPETFDTLKEIADWIESHSPEAAEIVEDINRLNEKTANIENAVSNIADVVFEKECKYDNLSFVLDQSGRITDPATMITEFFATDEDGNKIPLQCGAEGNPDTNFISWLKKNTHNYVVKRDFNKYYLKQLDDKNIQKYADGTSSAKDIEDYHFGVYTKFPTDVYVSAKDISNTKGNWDLVQITIRSKSIDENNEYLCITSKDLIGTFPTNTQTGNVSPWYSGFNKPVKIGNNTVSFPYNIHKLFILLFYAWYGNTDISSKYQNDVAKNYNTGKSYIYNDTPIQAHEDVFGSTNTKFWLLEDLYTNGIQPITRLKINSKSEILNSINYLYNDGILHFITIDGTHYAGTRNTIEDQVTEYINNTTDTIFYKISGVYSSKYLYVFESNLGDLYVNKFTFGPCVDFGVKSATNSKTGYNENYYYKNITENADAYRLLFNKYDNNKLIHNAFIPPANIDNHISINDNITSRDILTNCDITIVTGSLK